MTKNKIHLCNLSEQKLKFSSFHNKWKIVAKVERFQYAVYKIALITFMLPVILSIFALVFYPLFKALGAIDLQQAIIHRSAVLFIPSLIASYAVYFVWPMYRSYGRKTLKKVFRDFAASNNLGLKTREGIILLEADFNGNNVLINPENLAVGTILKASFPEIFIMHKSIPSITIPMKNNPSRRITSSEFNKQQKYDLEGEFIAKYDIYAPHATATSVLSLLNPKVMDALLRTPCSIYVKDNNIFYGLPRRKLYKKDWSKYLEYLLTSSVTLHSTILGVSNLNSASSLSVPWQLQHYSVAPTYDGYRRFVKYGTLSLIAILPLYLLWYANSLDRSGTFLNHYNDVAFLFFIGLIVAAPTAAAYYYTMQKFGGRFYSYLVNWLTGRLR